MTQFLVLPLVVSVLAAARPAPPATQPTAARGPDIQPRYIRLRSDDFSDLEFLKPLLADCRIVQLGENTHGVREYNLLKDRIVRYLHEELNFTVLAFESDLYHCYTADRAAASATAKQTMTRSIFGVWHTEDLIPLFELIRTSRGSKHPLRLAGFDIQPIGPNKESRPAFLASAVDAVGADYVAEVLALDRLFLDVYARGVRERREFFRSAAGQQMAADYDRLAETLTPIAAGAREEQSAVERDRVRVARQVAVSLAAYIRQQAALTTRDYVEIRDRGMAANLKFLAEELYPDAKIIVWAHNFHVRYDNAAIQPVAGVFPDARAHTMGHWTREHFGRQVYTVGCYAHHGHAADNGGETFVIPVPPEQSVEACLNPPDERASFVDCATPLGADGSDWRRTPLVARYNGVTPIKIACCNQYDAIVVLGEVTPRVPLR